MRYPHFFKARSRIGLKNAPYRQLQLNLGVEEGPDAILTGEFLRNFPKLEVSDYSFANPEWLREDEFNKVLAAQLKDFTNLVLSQTGPGQTQVVVGGDHSVTFSSIAATTAKYNPKDIGYVHIDSHPDSNLSASSPTQNFHGMYLRPFIKDDFDIPEINGLPVSKLLPQNMLFIGHLDIDEGERFLFERLNIKKVDPNTVDINKFFKSFIKNFKHLHVNLDIDVFDKAIAPATGIPAEKGITEEEIFPVLEIISKFPSISFDLVEVNPKKAGAEQTIDLARAVLKRILW